MSEIQHNQGGVCKLCLQMERLQDSHILPKFAYKTYASNQNKGGSFIDLTAGKIHNKHLTYDLLCASCENRFSRSENYAARFLKRVGQNPNNLHDYDSSLLYFAVSILWRVAQHRKQLDLEHNAKMILAPACKQWRRFLLGQTKDVLPYSLHGFIAFGQSIAGKDAEWHKGIGWQVFANERLVFSRIGPLLIYGLLDRVRPDQHEIKTWELSRLRASGGQVQPISKNRPERALTATFARVLNKVERTCIDFAASLRV